jgi:hypothetical protein
VHASKDALSLNVRTASPHKSDDLLDRESMRPHDCLSTALRQEASSTSARRWSTVRPRLWRGLCVGMG